MDEGRKRVILIAAAILAAGKLMQFELEKRSPASVGIIHDAIVWAERILAAIDRRWPIEKPDGP